MSGCGKLASMSGYARRLICSVLTILMVNTMAWSYSPEAFADWLSTEQKELATLDQSASDAGMQGDQDQDQACNHGCHVVNHLLGEVGQTTGVAPVAVTQGCRYVRLLSLPDVAASGPFRPPRVSS